MRVLIAEDDSILADGLVRSLRHSGYAVDAVKSGVEADSALSTAEFDLLILDLGLPRMSGLEVLKRLRGRDSHVPVLILTALDGVQDRVRGLDLGADDYLAKPFDLDELEARIRALHRRSAGSNEDVDHDAPAWGQLRFDRQSGAFYHGHLVLDLSPRELRLLHALAARSGRAVTREHLLDLVFANEADVQPEAVEVVVYRLRKKLAGTGASLMTLRGLGYLLKAGE